MIKDYITRKDENDKYRYSGVHITQKENESEFFFLKRVQHVTYHFRLAYNKDNYIVVKDFTEKGMKRVLIYIEIIK